MNYFKLLPFIMLLSFQVQIVASDAFIKKLLVYCALISNIGSGSVNSNPLRRPATGSTPQLMSTTDASSANNPLFFPKKGIVAACLKNNTDLDAWFRNKDVIDQTADALGSKPFCLSEVRDIAYNQVYRVLSNSLFFNDDPVEQTSRTGALYRAVIACHTPKICPTSSQNNSPTPIPSNNPTHTLVTEPVMNFPQEAVLQRCLEQRWPIGSWYQQKKIAPYMAKILGGKRFTVSAAYGTAQNLIIGIMQNSSLVPNTPAWVNTMHARTATVHATVQECQLQQG